MADGSICCRIWACLDPVRFFGFPQLAAFFFGLGVFFSGRPRSGLRAVIGAAPPSAEECPRDENGDGNKRRSDEEVVEWRALVLTSRVESHGVQYGVSRFVRPVATVSSVPVTRRSVFVRLCLVSGLALVLTACGGVAPEVAEGSDPVLFEGRSIWTGQCASCHGAAGGGGRGPKLADGRVLDRFPEAASQEALVLNGRGGMPSFAGRLSDEQITAVTRYTREVLTVTE